MGIIMFILSGMHRNFPLYILMHFALLLESLLEVRLKQINQLLLSKELISVGKSSLTNFMNAQVWSLFSSHFQVQHIRASILNKFGGLSLKRAESLLK
jgi:hypothetical protein